MSTVPDIDDALGGDCAGIPGQVELAIVRQARGEKVHTGEVVTCIHSGRPTPHKWAYMPGYDKNHPELWYQPPAEAGPSGDCDGLDP